MFVHLDTPNIPEIKAKTINGVRHYTTPEGLVYPSVTTVLGQKEKPWLENWRQMLGPQKAAKETKRCAERGNNIHELVERYLKNEDENFIREYNFEHVRGFNQLKMRLNKIDNIRAQELAIWSDQLKVAGRVDCVGEYDGVLSIIDFKTSNNNKTDEMVEDYFLQCTAYAIMWFERTGESIEDITILMSVEKGIVPLIFQDKIDKYVKPLLTRIKNYTDR